MKAILVRHPIHTTLETTKESWKQGDVIEGVLRFKNESNEAHTLSGELAAIYPSTIKEVREGSLPTSKTLFSLELPSELSLDAGQELEINYQYVLETDAPITDKTSGLFFYFGNPENKLSSLALNVEPHQRLAELLQNIELFLRFKTKSIKAKKDKIEIKMLPPPSKEYAALEAVTMMVKFKEENIHLDYKMKIKKLDYANAATQMTPSMQKGEMKKADKLTPSDYLVFGKAFNGEKVAQRVESAFSEAKTKPII